MAEQASILEIREHLLVSAAQAGNQDAFEQLFKLHAGRVFRTARRITKNHEDAEDAAQESFVNAFVHLNSFDGRSRFSTWLTRIAMNAALTVLRRRSNALEVPVLSSSDPVRHSLLLDRRDAALDPEERYADQERKWLVARAVFRLRPTLRETVEFYHTRQCSVRQTARLLGIPETTVKARLVRARRALRRNIPVSAPKI